jgi:hypothetical protein
MVVLLDEELALAAGPVSNTTKLAMADSIIDATAQVHQAQLVTGVPDALPKNVCRKNLKNCRDRTSCLDRPYPRQ